MHIKSLRLSNLNNKIKLLLLLQKHKILNDINLPKNNLKKKNS